MFDVPLITIDKIYVDAKKTEVTFPTKKQIKILLTQTGADSTINFSVAKPGGSKAFKDGGVMKATTIITLTIVVDVNEDDFNFYDLAFGKGVDFVNNVKISSIALSLDKIDLACTGSQLKIYPAVIQLFKTFESDIKKFASDFAANQGPALANPILKKYFIENIGEGKKNGLQVAKALKNKKPAEAAAAIDSSKPASSAQYVVRSSSAKSFSKPKGEVAVQTFKKGQRLLVTKQQDGFGLVGKDLWIQMSDLKKASS